MKTLLIIFTISITTLLASCGGTIQTYEGPELPPEKVAIIQADPRTIFDQVISIADQATVYAVDGVESGINQTNAVVLPGEHTITIRLDKVRGPVFYWTSRTLTLNAEAGHIYIVYGKIIDEDNVFTWIEDKETGLIVAGAKPD